MRSEVERKQTLSHINSRIDTSLARACGHMYEEHTAHTHTGLSKHPSPRGECEPWKEWDRKDAYACFVSVICFFPRVTLPQTPFWSHRSPISFRMVIAKKDPIPIVFSGELMPRPTPTFCWCLCILHHAFHLPLLSGWALNWQSFTFLPRSLAAATNAQTRGNDLPILLREDSEHSFTVKEALRGSMKNGKPIPGTTYSASLLPPQSWNRKRMQ